jgi:hypothetical protein
VIKTARQLIDDRREMKISACCLVAAIQFFTSNFSIAGDIPVTLATDSIAALPVRTPPSRLCSDDPGNRALVAPIDNDEMRTFRALMGISPIAISVRYKSSDWQNVNEIGDQVERILQARPRQPSPIINWSEGADFRHRTFFAVIQTTAQIEVRLEVSGYQVCGSDSKGRFWYFRNVPIDLWPLAKNGVLLFCPLFPRDQTTDAGDRMAEFLGDLT